MQTNDLYIVGSFKDQPSRITAYAAAAGSLGATTRFIGTINEVDYHNLAAERFLFTDETAICAAYAATREDKTNSSLENKLRILMQLSDKFSARQLTSSAFPHEHFVVQSVSELESIPIVEGAWLCKPRWGSNSRDVREISSPCGVREAVKPILARDNHALIERHIEGTHICIDFNWTGRELFVIGHCEKRMTNCGQKIAEAFHTLSNGIGNHAEAARQGLLPMMREHFSDVCFTVHGEFIVEAATGNLKIAELNPRAPWGMLPELFSIGNGINFDAAVLANALGKEFCTVSEVNPAVLGSIFSSDFFSQHETVVSRGNTLFVERFELSENQETVQGKLVKHGRFLLWGASQNSVEIEWRDLSAIAAPDEIRLANQLDTSDTWKSKCC